MFDPAQAVLTLVVVANLACGAGVPAPAQSVVPTASANDVDVTLYLVGDAGAPAPGFEPVLAALSADLAAADTRQVVVYLGDNIYPRGLPESTDPTRAEAERRLNAQIDVIRVANVSGIFVPGNHDWGERGGGGWDSVRRQARYIDTRGGGVATMLPRDGCPGPEVKDVGRTARLLLMDTQWWLHDGPKPTGPISDCPTDSEAEVTNSLRSALADAGRRVTVVLAHHPIRTAGPHGGYFDWDKHIFPLRAFKGWLWVPLPVIGSLYPLARNLGLSPQDVSGSSNRRMRDSLRAAFSGHPPLIYAGGHEHSLQVVLGQSEAYALVSGSGIYGHTSPVGCPTDWLFCDDISGYMRIDFLHSGQTRLGVMAVDSEGGRAEVFSMFLEPRPAP